MVCCWANLFSLLKNNQTCGRRESNFGLCWMAQGYLFHKVSCQCNKQFLDAFLSFFFFASFFDISWSDKDTWLDAAAWAAWRRRFGVDGDPLEVKVCFVWITTFTKMYFCCAAEWSCWKCVVAPSKCWSMEKFEKIVGTGVYVRCCNNIRLRRSNRNIFGNQPIYHQLLVYGVRWLKLMWGSIAETKFDWICRQLVNCHLLSLRTEVGHWASVKHVNVWNIAWFADVCKLQGNGLTELPDCVGNWSRLETIDVSECLCSALIVRCQLSGNELETLPPTVSNWVLLQRLQVCCCDKPFWPSAAELQSIVQSSRCLEYLYEIGSGYGMYGVL